MLQVDYRIYPTETLTIKAFAIIAMLVHHLFWLHSEYGQILCYLANAGKVCITIFVFLSGYGMAMIFPSRNGGWKNGGKTILFFLGKRYSKFFLNYWVVFFASVFVGSCCFGRTLEIAYGVNANLVSAFIKDLWGQLGFYSYNITWWFNELILSLWLLFPLFYWLMKNKITSVSILLFLLINPGGMLSALEFFANGLSIFMFPFCVGIFFAQRYKCVNRILNTISSRWIPYASFLLAAIIFFVRGAELVSWLPKYLLDMFVTLLMAISVVSFVRTTGCKLQFFQFIGKHSMNMYLTHTFIFGYFFHDFIYGLKYPILMFLALFGISLLISVVIEFAKNKLSFYRLQSKIVALISRQIPSSHN